jgi:hypothetical protein
MIEPDRNWEVTDSLVQPDIATSENALDRGYLHRGKVSAVQDAVTAQARRPRLGFVLAKEEDGL